MSDQPLAGQVALVTGGGRGIGREHALALAAAGARVVVNDLGVAFDGSGSSDGPGGEVVQEILRRGGEAVADFGSVADFEQAGDLVHRAVAEFGRLDLVVNNASVFKDGPFETMTADDFDADMAVHVRGSFNMCKHALPIMLWQGRGRIVNTTSNSAYEGVGYAAYAAAKGAITSLTLALAAEYAQSGVTVNAIAPGAMTQMRAKHGEEWLARIAAAGIRQPVLAPAPPALSADYVPPMVVFLASDAASDISGQVFETIGGSIGLYAKPQVVRRIAKDPDDGPWTFSQLRKTIGQLGIGW
jgi:NAD(P)-dependent dehydrogenase (short-subunit alcohol dehydrogenase family)